MNRDERLEGARLCRLQTQEHYEEILDRIATLRLEKVIEYGEERYLEDDLKFNVWMSYSDIYRKHIRLRKLTEDAAKSGVASPALLDAYMDLANYAIMGLQVLEDYADEK